MLIRSGICAVAWAIAGNFAGSATMVRIRSRDMVLRCGLIECAQEAGGRSTSVARYWQEVNLPRSWTPVAQASCTDPITLRPGGGASAAATRDRKSVV